MPYTLLPALTAAFKWSQGRANVNLEACAKCNPKIQGGDGCMRRKHAPPADTSVVRRSRSPPQTPDI